MKKGERAKRRKRVERLLKADPDRSNRSIAAEARVDHKTVEAVRNDLKKSGEFRTAGQIADAGAALVDPIAILGEIAQDAELPAGARVQACRALLVLDRALPDSGEAPSDALNRRTLEIMNRGRLN